ncbi:gamma-tocopherol methyltransferase [Nannochloropsis oceanica]
MKLTTTVVLVGSMALTQAFSTPSPKPTSPLFGSSSRGSGNPQQVSSSSPPSSSSCPASFTSNTPLSSSASSSPSPPKRKGFSHFFDKLNPLKYRDFGVGTELKDGIATFYDESTAIWEEVWGEHLHHGYYYTGKEKNHQKAQVDMIEESLKFAGVGDVTTSGVKRAVDVGCGIGGSSRFLATKYGAQVRGITLSPFQCRRAQFLTQKAGLEDKAKFSVADALAMPFQKETFDLVWSMESGEHMPDKKQFMRELVRVAAPGGRIVVVTWCHRNLKDGEKLTRFERGLLKLINSIYFLPPWVSMNRYVALAEEEGLEGIKTADWTQVVKPFWPAVLVSCLNWKSIKVLFTSETVRKGALAILYMMVGYSVGLIKFGVITGQKKK